MGDAALTALQHILTPGSILYLLIGVGVGMVVGMLPGLGGVAGTSLVLPFLFGMDPYHGIALLVGVQAVTTVSDTYPAVLIGVPGTAGSQATIIDGHAMARKGEAARALGAGYSASMFGGLIGAVGLLLAITVARPFLGSIGSPELFMLTVLGLVTVGVVVRGDPILGIASAAFGVMLGMVGTAPATPDFRYTFNSVYLLDGLPTVCVALGIFAIPEILALASSKNSISETPALNGGVWDGFRETLKYRWLIIRSALIGVGLGVIPGVGGSVIDWIAYAHARATARDKSQFGKGDIRGVIGTESATNAREGGTLVPTLLLGIPGNASSAVLLGGLVLLGITPGPQMITTNLSITLTVVWSLVLAHLIATVIAFAASKPVAKITLIPGKVLAPLLLVVVSVAAYQATYSLGDLLVIVVLGLIAYWMKLVGWPRAPIIIGFVLSDGLERYLHLSISLYGWEWLHRPLVIAIAVLVVLMLFGGPTLRMLRSERRRRLPAVDSLGVPVLGENPNGEADPQEPTRSDDTTTVSPPRDGMSR